jgi:hypothetical protein
VVCSTLSPHPDVERWYKIMGFDLAYQEGAFKQFIFQP